MFVGIIWSLLVDVVWGIFSGAWTGEDATSTNDTPPKPDPLPPPPKPVSTNYVPSGRDEVKLDTQTPTDTTGTYTPPPTLKVPATVETEVVEASLPNIWNWNEAPPWVTGPIPFLAWKINEWIRGKPPVDPRENLPGAEASTFRYGRLLTGVYSPETLPRTEWTYIVSPEDQKAHHQESYEGYQHWLGNQVAGIPYPEDYAGNIYDQAAILWPFDPRDYSAGLTFLFGSRFLSDIFANYWTRSLNYDACTLRGVVYKATNVDKVSPTWERNYLEGNPEEADGDLSKEGLATDIAKHLQAYRVYGPSNTYPTLILETAHPGASAMLLGKGSYPGLYPRSWCNKSAEEIQAEIDKERELLINELGNTSDPDITAAYEARLNELAKEAAEVNSGLVQLNKINNIPEHIQALSNCLAEVMGAYPFRILLEKGSFLRKKLIPLKLATMEKAEDVPITYRIDELPEEEISVPNVAEALAELTGMLLNLQGHQDLNMEFIQRISAELVALRATTAQTFDRTDAIMDFLGFDLSYVDEKMPISFTPNAEGDEILNLLQGSMVKYKKPLFKANKHNSTLQVQLYHLLKGASIIKAVHFRPFETDNPLSGLFEDDNSEFGQYLKKLVNGLNKDGEAKFKKSDGTEVTMGFDEFIEFVETGWTQFTLDPNDARKPYGKDYTKRPRIWDLSKGDD